MHGLINRAIECFARDSYGEQLWTDVIRQLDLGISEFEPMMDYDDSLTVLLVKELAHRLARPQDEVLEDIGIYLVAHPNAEALRRLLRFGGVTFSDFLHSLDDLPARARLAVPDLELPQLELREHNCGAYSLIVRSNPHYEIQFGHVFVGLLRAIADDYGTLMFLNHIGGQSCEEILEIRIIQQEYSTDRGLALGVPAQ